MKWGVLFSFYRACLVHSFSCGLVTDGVGFDSILHWKYESLSHFSILGNKLAFRIADSVLGQKFL